MHLKTDHLLLDRYKIISKLGRGGFADVYKAFDTRMERIVAIKQIHVSRHSAERVLREARTVALLNHPNIVTIHEFEREDEECYLIMEHVEGVPLSKILSRISPLQAEEAIVIAIEICRALEAAHLNNIIHRDIKPENIMIRHDGRLKIMDFGIARLKGMSGTTDGDIIGTFAYMSPEQARGDEVDERSDIYSLGIVLYEMLTDCIPFSGESAPETLKMVQNVQALPPSELNPSLTKEFDECIMTAIAKDPRQRYETASAFHEALVGLRVSLAPTEKILSGLVDRYIEIENELGWFAETGWRGRLWRFFYQHRESLIRVPTAIMLSYPFFLIMRFWYGMSKSLSLFIAAIIYMAVLLRPDYGIGVAFLALSLLMVTYSFGLSFVMLLVLIPYWFFISRRWPIASITPAGGPIFGLLHIPFVFPILAGLLTNPIIAALVAGFGCVAFELMNIFLKTSIEPELIRGYSMWSLLRGESNPIYVAQLISSPFLENPALVLQPMLWAIVAALSSAIKGTRRWFAATLTGFISLLMGYQLIFARFGTNLIDMGRLMQGLSFSLIILLLLPIFRPPARDLEEGSFESDEFTD